MRVAEMSIAPRSTFQATTVPMGNRSHKSLFLTTLAWWQSVGLRRTASRERDKASGIEIDRWQLSADTCLLPRR